MLIVKIVSEVGKYSERNLKSAEVCRSANVSNTKPRIGLTGNCYWHLDDDDDDEFILLMFARSLHVAIFWEIGGGEGICAFVGNNFFFGGGRLT